MVAIPMESINSNMRYYLGLDLSLSNSGVCVIDNLGVIKRLVSIETKRKGDLPNQRFCRYHEIVISLKDIIKGFGFKAIAIENYSYASKGKIIQLVESGSLVRNLFVPSMTNEIMEVAPISLKKFILGTVKAKGKEAKNIMCREVFKRDGIDIDDDNQLDAYLLAQIALLYDKIQNNEDVSRYFRYQIEVVVNIIKKEELAIKKQEKKK